MQNAKEGCSDELLWTGYWLTDIYDHVSEYDKSVKIARKILHLIKNSKERQTNIHLHKMIGCTYSIAIAKTDDAALKKQWINEAEGLFEDLKHILLENNALDDQDRFFLEDLYYSDYAAFIINKGDWEYEQGGDKESTDK